MNRPDGEVLNYKSPLPIGDFAAVTIYFKKGEIFVDSQRDFEFGRNVDYAYYPRQAPPRSAEIL